MEDHNPGLGCIIIYRKANILTYASTEDFGLWTERINSLISFQLNTETLQGLWNRKRYRHYCHLKNSVSWVSYVLPDSNLTRNRKSHPDFHRTYHFFNVFWTEWYRWSSFSNFLRSFFQL